MEYVCSDRNNFIVTIIRYTETMSWYGFDISD